MGNEAFCKVRVGKQESEGKALLETSEILFRGDFRLKIPLSTVKSAKAAGGELCLETAEILTTEFAINCAECRYEGDHG